MASGKNRSHKQREKSRRRNMDRNERLQAAAADELLLARAMDAHRSGNLERAKQGYRQLIESRPRHFTAIHLLGFAEFQAGNFQKAIRHIESAIAIQPGVGEFHANLALSYLAAHSMEKAREHATEAARLGHRDANGFMHLAVEFLERNQLTIGNTAAELGIQIEPTSAELHNIQGIIYAKSQLLDEAERSYRRALELNPNYPEACNNLGNALRDRNRNEEAIPFYARAIALCPTFATAHNNLGIALANLGNTQRAIECYGEALRLEPNCVEAINNLGNAYREIGNRDAAVDCYRRALTLNPRSGEIWANLGVAQRQRGHSRDALAAFRRALIFQPTSTKIYNHMGWSLYEQNRLTESAQCFRHLLRLEPQQTLWGLQAASVCPAVFDDREAMARYWTELEQEITTVRQNGFSFDFAQFITDAPAAPFNLQFYDRCVRTIKENFAAVYHTRLSTAYQCHWIDAWVPPRHRPRVGIVVTEDHEGLFLKSLQGVIERIGVREFELVVFASLRAQTLLKTQISRKDIQFVPLPTRLDLVAKAIDEARCDILYHWEVGTDSFNYFLPFLRLAPIQMTSWGIQVTTGIPNVDYYVSSSLAEPADAAQHYSERLILADTYLTYRTRTQLPGQPCSRESFALPVDKHWYVCAQQLGKFHVDFDEMLAEILRRDPDGIVVATGDKTGHLVVQLRDRFQRSSPDVADRIHFVSRLQLPQYLSLLHQADVLLDPPHFGGVNSTYDGLSLGKAIVVLPSKFHRGRYTLGCYRKMGMEDCIAKSVADYADIAVRIGTDRAYRTALEKRILDASSVLFEDPGAVSEHERIFHELIARGRVC